jgi:3-phenylpropionate/trans-cinnamate dioxygenase ferredoxin reductase component
VIEALPRLLTRGVPAEVAEVLHERHVAQGVSFHFGARTTGITDAGVVLSDATIVRADLVVVGIGAVPNTELAVAAGLAVDNGIAVDATLATSDPDIFAAGDCCSFPHPLYGDRRIRLEAWRNAHDQAAAAARNLLGADEPYAAVPWFWSDQYDLTLQIAGLPDAATTEVVRRRPDGVEIRFGLGPGGRLASAAAIGQGNAVAKDIRLAEMLIATQAAPEPTALADPAVQLKALLRARKAR